MNHLRSIDIKEFPEEVSYPFNLPVVRGWAVQELNAPVTIFVGENGSGKSTILEAVAAAAQMTTVGSESVGQDATLRAARSLGDQLKLVWNKRTRKGFFLRSEDYFGYVKAQSRSRAEMEAEIKRVDQEYTNRTDYAKSLAKLPFRGQLSDMKKRYGESLDHYSHGESFLALFQTRFVPGGLYLLDEPETPLSPIRQLSLLSMLKEMITKEAQFIIATHSPILMAFPGAEILSFDEVPPKTIAYQDLEHVNLTRDFLNNPEQFLRHL